MAQRPLDSDENANYPRESLNAEDNIISDDDINLMGIVSELEADNGAYVSVYRASAGRSKGAYIFRCSPSEFSLPDILDKLRDEYGGGDFRLIVSRNGAMVKNSSINVEKPRLLPQKTDEKLQNNTGEFATLLMQMQSAQQQQADSMRDMMMQQSEKNSAMMLEIVRATSGNRGEQPTMIDMIQTMVALQQLNPAPAPSESIGPEKLLDMFFKGMEQGKELSGGGGDDSILQTAIKAFGPSIGEITSKLSAIEQKPVPVRSRVPQPSGVLATPLAVAGALQPAVPLIEDEPVFDNFLKATQAMQQFSPYINMLVNAARQDADVEVYANLILDQLDDDTIAEWVINPDNYKKVMAYLPPEVNANPDYVQWFDDLRMVVVALLNESGEDDAHVSGDSEHETAISDQSRDEPTEKS